jgi:plasmid stability protein
MAEDTSRTWKDQYMLRFPDGMRDRLKALAAANNRSLNAEIISRLEDTLAFDDSSPTKDDPETVARREFLRELQITYRMKLMDRAIRKLADERGVEIDLPEYKP